MKKLFTKIKIKIKTSSIFLLERDIKRLKKEIQLKKEFLKYVEANYFMIISEEDKKIAVDTITKIIELRKEELKIRESQLNLLIDKAEI